MANQILRAHVGGTMEAKVTFYLVEILISVSVQ